MNPCAIKNGEISIIPIPLKIPFITSLGSKYGTKNVAVRLRLEGGAEGYGEASGSVVMAHQSPRMLVNSLRSMLTHFRGHSVAEIGPLARDIREGFRRTPAAAAAFECAALDAFVKESGLTMSEWFGGRKTRVETDITLSADTPQRTSESARSAAREGFRTLKIKVGRGGARADLARVMAAHRAFAGRSPAIILDGNQGLSVSGTLRLVASCLQAGLDIVLVEQPLPHDDIRGLRRLTARSPVPIAADESVRSAADALRLAEAQAVNVLNVKIGKTGIQETLDIMTIAHAAGMKLMIGCMQESGLGLSPSVHLACATGAFHYIDLDSDHLLGDPQPRGGFTRKGRFLSVV